MSVLDRLLQVDLVYWDNMIYDYEQRNRNLKVPNENTTSTLHDFNIRVNDFLTEALYEFGRARRNKDAIQRLIENITKDYYQGPNEHARKAAGIQFARQFPTPDNYPYPNVNLFDLEDKFVGYYYSLEATVKSLQAKGDAKVTNNSLLKIEQSIIPS